MTYVVPATNVVFQLNTPPPVPDSISVTQSLAYRITHPVVALTHISIDTSLQPTVAVNVVTTLLAHEESGDVLAVSATDSGITTPHT